MATYSTNEFRPGLKVLLEGDPCSILDSEFVKPGKGQAFTRVKLRNLKTGRVWERTYRSGEALDAADVRERKWSTSTRTASSGTSCAPTAATSRWPPLARRLSDADHWLREQDVCTVTLWDGDPIAVVPPNFVELEVTETDPGIRGDTAQGGTKPATVSTGAVVKVPLFVEIGDVLKIDTRTGEYVNRVKT